MFCKECGTNLPDVAKFCSQCGTFVGEKLSVENKVSIDNSRIIREDTFRLNGTGIIHEKGVLRLFANRLEWNGSTKFEIKISDILQVSVKDNFGSGFLVVKTNNSETKFAMINKTTVALAAFGLGDIAAMSDKKIMDLEYWRMEIENLRKIK